MHQRSPKVGAVLASVLDGLGFKLDINLVNGRFVTKNLHRGPKSDTRSKLTSHKDGVLTRMSIGLQQR